MLSLLLTVSSISLKVLPLAHDSNIVLGYQYAVFWTADASNTSVRHPSVSRRGLQGSSGWETFTLSDYDGTDDDGHDV